MLINTDNPLTHPHKSLKYVFGEAKKPITIIFIIISIKNIMLQINSRVKLN